MYKIQEIFQKSYEAYCHQYQPSPVQDKAAHSIMQCKTGTLGCNVCICDECGHLETHHNSCKNRNCPCCQVVLKELWIDKRKSEVIDAPYFHVVFTIPSELNALVYANQSLLYSLLHKCSSRTLLELSASEKHLGATPGIIQVLHTWGSKLNFHPHIHCIVAGAGLTKAKQLKKCNSKFFIAESVLGRKFRGKFLAELHQLYLSKQLHFSNSCKKLQNSYNWNEFKDSLYKKNWIPDARETFNGFGNAIDYLGRYTHRIAISNSRILHVSDTDVTYTAKDYKSDTNVTLTISHVEFIRRFLMHILPTGFQKIRYYGFLNNRYKTVNLKLISKLTGKALFKSMYADATIAEILHSLWNVNINQCPNCGGNHLNYAGRTYHMRN